MADEIQKANNNSQSTQLGQFSPTHRIVARLGELAIARGGAWTEAGLKIYSRELSMEPFETVMDVLAKITITDRQGGELAIPTLGAMLNLVRDQTHPHKVLRKIVRRFCTNFGVTPTEDLFETWDEVFGQRTDDDLEFGYKAVMRADHVKKMPTTGQFQAACPPMTKRRVE